METPVVIDTAADPPRPRIKSAKSGIVGPLFRWELVRLARRGQDHRARFILAVTLLFALSLFTIWWFPNVDLGELLFGTSQILPLKDSATFGNSFTLTFLLTQLAVLVLLTPAYAAGGIAEDKEKQTFAFLLVSDLTNREIVFGKFLGRLVFLLGILVAGLPVLALTQVFGGVSMKFLLMGYFLTATTVVMLASISVASAVATNTFRGALFRSYGLAALHVLVGCGIHPMLSPFAIIITLYGIEAEGPGAFLMVGLAYGGSQLAIAILAVHMAVRWVRKQRTLPARRPESRGRRPLPRRREGASANGTPTMNLEPVEHVAIQPDDQVESLNGEAAPQARPLPAAVRVDDGRPRRRRPDLPPVRRAGTAVEFEVDRPRVYGNDPFYWKEKYTTGRKRTADDDSIRGVVFAISAAVGVIIAFFVLIALVSLLVDESGGDGQSFGQRVLVMAGVGGLFSYMIAVGSGAAGTVVRERQLRTIESLLTIPVPRSEILWAKWKVNCQRGVWWGAPTIVLLPFGMLLTEAPLTALPAALYAVTAIPCTVSLALWLSTRCQTMTRAVLWLLPAIGIMLLVPVVAWNACDAEMWVYTLVGMSVAAVTAAGIAVLFWQLALGEFEREGR